MAKHSIEQIILTTNVYGEGKYNFPSIPQEFH